MDSVVIGLGSSRHCLLLESLDECGRFTDPSEHELGDQERCLVVAADKLLSNGLSRAIQLAASSSSLGT